MSNLKVKIQPDIENTKTLTGPHPSTEMDTELTFHVNSKTAIEWELELLIPNDFSMPSAIKNASVILGLRCSACA